MGIMATGNPNDLLTSLDASRELGCSPERVRQLAKDGTLPIANSTTGGIRLFKRSDVDRLKRERDKAKAAAA